MAIYKIAILVVGGAFPRQAAQFEHLSYVVYNVQFVFLGLRHGLLQQGQTPKV